MKMHHQTAHITLSKQHLCPGFPKREKNLSEMERQLETKRKKKSLFFFFCLFPPFLLIPEYPAKTERNRHGLETKRKDGKCNLLKI